MKRLVVLAGCALCMAAPAAAQQAPSDSTAVHVVRPGDTLWDLARRYLENPYLWRRIYELNRDVVADPDWIYPAERIRIPGLVVQPGEATVQTEAGVLDRTVFFPGDRAEAEAERRRIQMLQERTRPVVTEGDFHRAGFLVPEEEVTRVGVVAEPVSPSVTPMRIARDIQLYDRVLVRLSGPLAVGDRLHLVRPERAVAGHGRVFASTGLATVVAVEGAVATVVIDEMHDEVEPGDWALPVAAYPVVPGEAPQPASGLEGRILAFLSPHALQAVEDVAFVDLGRDAGVREGDVFVAVMPPTRASWGTRPEVEIARLQVVRASRRTAALRVVEMEQPALTAGLPVRLVGKMP